MICGNHVPKLFRFRNSVGSILEITFARPSCVFCKLANLTSRIFRLACLKTDSLICVGGSIAGGGNVSVTARAASSVELDAP